MSSMNHPLTKLQNTSRILNYNPDHKKRMCRPYKVLKNNLWAYTG